MDRIADPDAAHSRHAQADRRGPAKRMPGAASSPREADPLAGGPSGKDGPQLAARPLLPGPAFGVVCS
jgi:hypothetical protein